jgi:hypothetical protein
MMRWVTHIHEMEIERLIEIKRIDEEIARLIEQMKAWTDASDPTIQSCLNRLRYELRGEQGEFSDRREQAENNGVARAYNHLLNYLSHEMQQEMKDYLKDGIEERSRKRKPLKPFIISETVSLVLSIGKLKLFELRKSFRRKVS